MIIYGVHPVEEILRVSPSAVLRVSATRWNEKELSTVRSLCEAAGITTESISGEALDELASGGNHQGVVCETAPYRYAALDTILESTADLSNALILVLDQIQDPQNLGALLRSAAAFDVAAVVIPKDRAAGVTHSVIRASAGLAYRVPIVQVVNVSRTLQQLKEHGWWTVGTFMDDSSAVDAIDFDMKAAVVLGSEHSGIRRLVGENCDLRCSIPTTSGVESLNVSVAGAILMFESYRQRQAARS